MSKNDFSLKQTQIEELIICNDDDDKDFPHIITTDCISETKIDTAPIDYNTNFLMTYEDILMKLSGINDSKVYELKLNLFIEKCIEINYGDPIFALKIGYELFFTIEHAKYISNKNTNEHFIELKMFMKSKQKGRTSKFKFKKFLFIGNFE